MRDFVSCWLLFPPRRSCDFSCPKSSRLQSLRNRQYQQNCEVMAEHSVGRGNKQAELSSSSPVNRMYAKILLKRNNTPGLSPWTFDSRRRSLVLRPLPLTFEERMLRRRQHLAHLLLRGSVSNGTLKTSFVWNNFLLIAISRLEKSTVSPRLENWGNVLHRTEISHSSTRFLAGKKQPIFEQWYYGITDRKNENWVLTGVCFCPQPWG